MSGLRLYLFLFYLIFLMGTFAFGQASSSYPDQYSVYFQNMALISPAFIPDEGKADFVAGYKTRTGAFKKVATYSFSGAILKRRSNNSVHAARVFVLNEKQGPYISSPSGYLNYAYQLPVFDNINVSTGFAFGFSGVYFSAPSASGTASALIPDGSLGLSLNGENLEFGFSAMQVFNSKSTPISSLIILTRYFNSYIKLKKDLNPFWRVNLYGLWRTFPDVSDDINGGLTLEFKEHFGFGAILRYEKGVSFLLTLSPLQEDEGLDISFAYNSTLLSPMSTLHNSLEFILAFKMY